MVETTQFNADTLLFIVYQLLHSKYHGNGSVNDAIRNPETAEQEQVRALKQQYIDLMMRELQAPKATSIPSLPPVEARLHVV